jgi:hypothetical protein
MIASIAAEGQPTKPAPFGHALVELARRRPEVIGGGVPRGDDRGGDRHRRRHAGDHGQRGHRLFLTVDQMPMRFAEWVSATIDNKILIIVALNVLMLLIGMPLDLPPAILLPVRSSYRLRR